MKGNLDLTETWGAVGQGRFSRGIDEVAGNLDGNVAKRVACLWTEKCSGHLNADLRRTLEAYGRPQEKDDCRLALDEGLRKKIYPEYETTLWSSNDMFVTLRTLASDPLPPEYLTS